MFSVFPGGWGWLVCGAAFMAHLLTSGLQLAFGLLYLYVMKFLIRKHQDKEFYIMATGKTHKLSTVLPFWWHFFRDRTITRCNNTWPHKMTENYTSCRRRCIIIFSCLQIIQFQTLYTFTFMVFITWTRIITDNHTKLSNLCI